MMLSLVFYSLYFFSLIVWFYFFFFKQKTAYEMRISDWSSDVCSSDLENAAGPMSSTSICRSICPVPLTVFLIIGGRTLCCGANPISGQACWPQSGDTVDRQDVV